MGMAPRLPCIRSAIHQQVEGVVRDRAIGVNAAVVAPAHLTLAVVVGIAILRQVGHVSESRRVVGAKLDVLADPPVGSHGRVEAVSIGKELDEGPIYQSRTSPGK